MKKKVVCNMLPQYPGLARFEVYNLYSFLLLVDLWCEKSVTAAVLPPFQIGRRALFDKYDSLRLDSMYLGCIRSRCWQLYPVMLRNDSNSADFVFIEPNCL
jgi:hypothetical protein